MAAETHWREEHRAAANCERQNFDYYLPHVYDDRDRRRLLFVGYILIKFRGGWETLSSTRGIARVLKTGERPSLIREREIDSIRALEDSTETIRLAPRFNCGDRVQVSDERSGFLGRYGITLGTPALGRVRVLLEIMGREIPAEFEVSGLEAA